MSLLRAALVLVLVAAFSLVLSGRILGVFQGRIVKSPFKDARKTWIVVQSKNGHVRKVNITRASVEYDDGYPAARKRAHPEESLCGATEVRITAEQAKSAKGDGEWRATEVLILSPVVERDARLVESALRDEPCRT